LILSISDRRRLIDKNHEELSINRQCELLEVSKGALYYTPQPIDPYTLCVMDLIDRQHTQTPFYGSRRLTAYLKTHGYNVNRKRVQRLMRLMRIEATYPKPQLSRREKTHKIYPYLLREIRIERPDQVWSTDITYIRIRNGFAYLTAIMDWYSRYVLSWRLSNTFENSFCVEALEEALEISQPEIFNTDQGTQYTAINFLTVLEKKNIQISMDSKGRALDNVFIERLWRTVKYEDVYLNDYQTMNDAYRHLKAYMSFYNNERLHQSLEYGVPRAWYPKACVTVSR